ncbi:MAG: N-acetylmuramoyl-L-alanine amidase [Sediminicola sp.]|jgi:N-acetylmuramoyl-L-alanine amidase
MKTRLLHTLILLFGSILFSSFAYINYNTVNPFVVVLDAGHGGHDPGNIGNGYKESDIALNIVLKIGAELEKIPNIKVIYTRKKNVFVELFERGAIANRADADLFVSVHCDSHTSNAYGAGTFVLGLHGNKRNLEVAKKENEVILLEENYRENYAGYDPNSPESFIGLTLMQEEYLDQSIMLASLIQDNFIKKLKRKDRSVKQAGFIVLHQSYMPSVLVETGFLTNKAEGAYLNSKKGQREMANSISNAILLYQKNIELATIDTQINTNINIKSNDNERVTSGEKVYPGVTFKVQLAVGSKKLALKPYNFNGLSEISIYPEGKIFKYYYGNTSDYSKILSMREFAKKKGYPTCYVVAFRNGDKVKLSDVLKSEDK